MPNGTIKMGYMMADSLRQTVQVYLRTCFLEVVRECSNRTHQGTDFV